MKTLIIENSFDRNRIPYKDLLHATFVVGIIKDQVFGLKNRYGLEDTILEDIQKHDIESYHKIMNKIQLYYRIEKLKTI